MLFQSQTFILLFLPVTLALYYATAGRNSRMKVWLWNSTGPP